MYNIDIGVGKYDVLEEIGEWDYGWTIGAMLRDSEGNLFFAVDSGCSCSSYGDGLTTGDLIPVKSWQEAVEQAKLTNDFTESEVYEFAKRLAAM